MYDRTQYESKLSTFDNAAWNLFRYARNTDANIILFTHPGVLLMVHIIEDKDIDTPENCLDSYAMDCWDEPWPIDDPEYPAWVLKASDIICECIAGNVGNRYLP